MQKKLSQIPLVCLLFYDGTQTIVAGVAIKSCISFRIITIFFSFEIFATAFLILSKTTVCFSATRFFLLTDSWFLAFSLNSFL